MFPLRLNLLPPEKKKYLQRMIFTEFTKSTLESILFLLCLAGIALLLGQSIMEEYFGELTTNIVATSNQNAKSNQEIKKINRLLREAKIAQENYILWSPILIELSNITPKEIILTNINLNAEKKNLTLTGNAGTREDLLLFENNIRALSSIASVNVPLSQLAEKTNISFSLIAQIK